MVKYYLKNGNNEKSARKSKMQIRRKGEVQHTDFQRWDPVH